MNNTNSLVATIRLQRPDLFQSYPLPLSTQPISTAYKPKLTPNGNTSSRGSNTSTAANSKSTSFPLELSPVVCYEEWDNSNNSNANFAWWITTPSPYPTTSTSSSLLAAGREVKLYYNGKGKFYHSLTGGELVNLSALIPFHIMKGLPSIPIELTVR